MKSPKQILRAAEAHLAQVKLRQDELDEAAYYDEAAIAEADRHRQEIYLPAREAVNAARAALGLPSLEEEETARRAAKKAAREAKEAARKAAEEAKRREEEAKQAAKEAARAEAARAEARAEFEARWPRDGFADAEGRRYVFLGEKLVTPPTPGNSGAWWEVLGHAGETGPASEWVPVYVREDGEVLHAFPVPEGGFFASAPHWEERHAHRVRGRERFQVHKWERDVRSQWVPAGAADPYEGFGGDHLSPAGWEEAIKARAAAQREARRKARERAEMEALEKRAQESNPFAALAALKKG